ncbi:MAG: tail fiber domain-containing protein [Verrucomicrobia bacterium]|nr:tail fiber domain-containing protein [Verrucomicrobiota bacterium]
MLLGEGSSVGGLPHATDLSSVFTGADASDRWIGITVDGSEVTPRIRFFAAPYAQLARSANSLVSGAQTGVLNATGNVTAEGSLASNGSIAGLIFQDRNGSTAWQWYSEDGKARLWNGGDKITVSNAGVIGSAGLTVSNKNAIELGVGITKEANAGKIGYETFTTGALDITGAGTATPRKIKLWDEIIVPGNATIGGSATLGGVTVNGNATVNGVLAATSLTSSAASPGFRLELTGSNLIAYKSGTSSTTLENTGGGSLNLQTTGGRVGIGTSTPQHMLEVSGVGPNSDRRQYGFLSAGGAGVFNSGNNANGISYSILANGRIGCAEFNAFSDARIKSLAGLSDSRVDLETIQKLRVTDYRMVDEVAEGDAIKKGFIAQEVEDVIPEAVSRSRQFVPDIYSNPSSFHFDPRRRELSLTLAKPHGLKAGDRVRIITEEATLDLNVIDGSSECEFVAGEVEKAPKQAFVYGKEVPDFRTLNYDRIFTTGIGAIQELARRVEELKKSEARIAELEQKTSRMAELEQKAARVDTLEREMAQLKKLVAGLAEAQAPKQVAGIQNISTVAGR